MTHKLTSLFIVLALSLPFSARAESTLCSCVRYVHSLVPEAPLINADRYRPNISAHVGSVAIFWYGPSKTYPKGTGHVALVTALRDDEFAITESNFHACSQGDRWVRFDDPALRGFYNPYGGDNSLAGS